MSIFTFSTINVNGQVKIENIPTSINANSALEIEATNKGLLMQRIIISVTNVVAPLSAYVAGVNGLRQVM